MGEDTEFKRHVSLQTRSDIDIYARAVEAGQLIGNDYHVNTVDAGKYIACHIGYGYPERVLTDNPDGDTMENSRDTDGILDPVDLRPRLFLTAKEALDALETYLRDEDALQSEYVKYLEEVSANEADEADEEDDNWTGIYEEDNEDDDSPYSPSETELLDKLRSSEGYRAAYDGIPYEVLEKENEQEEEGNHYMPVFVENALRKPD